MALNIIQITKINSLDFVFTDKTNISFPVPPLASAKLYYNGEVPTLKVCATLYINSKNSDQPEVADPIEGNNTLEIYFDYDWDEETPETYDVWYVEIDYTSATVENITEVISYLQNLNSTTPVGVGGDPVTSRGTKTSIPDDPTTTPPVKP